MEWILTEKELTLFAVLIPAIATIIIAVVKRRSHTTVSSTPPTELDFVKASVDKLKFEIERQHIKIDDISERLAWLEGRESK